MECMGQSTGSHRGNVRKASSILRYEVSELQLIKLRMVNESVNSALGPFNNGRCILDTMLIKFII